MPTPILTLITRYWRLAAYGAAAILIAWLWFSNGRLADQRDKARADAVACHKAGEAAKQAQIADKLAKELFYAHKAIQSEREHNAKLADVRSATDRFIAANRVRSQSGSGPGSNSTASSGDGASVAETMPGNSLVAITDIDVQRCSAATAYAVDAHNWAVETFKVP